MTFQSTWSHADTERLTILHQEGKSIPEAAEILGRSQKSLRDKSRYLGLIFKAAVWYPPPNMEWWGSENHVERLEELFEEGLSTVEIGRRLGISKNAVIGKLHRIALAFKPSPLRRYPIDDLLDEEEKSGHRCCRWPHGHPDQKDFHFCGAPAKDFLPYCAAHAAVAYERPKPDVKAAD